MGVFILRVEEAEVLADVEGLVVTLELLLGEYVLELVDGLDDTLDELLLGEYVLTLDEELEREGLIEVDGLEDVLLELEPPLV